MKKIGTVQALGNEIFKEQRPTIGMDLGDRWLFYCILDEAGKIILEQKLPTTPEAMKQTLGRIPRSLIALETGTHSPWVSRLLTEWGHEVLAEKSFGNLSPACWRVTLLTSGVFVKVPRLKMCRTYGALDFSHMVYTGLAARAALWRAYGACGETGKAGSQQSIGMSTCPARFRPAKPNKKWQHTVQ